METKRPRPAGGRLARLIACAAILAGPPCALAQDATVSAAELFQQGDYDAAADRWSAAAKAGSAEATFRLAQMSDLGLGTPRDPDRALRGYIAAGLRGHPAAQFNAGAMLGIGVDFPRDPRRAAFWYSLAAANGHARSAYDLGLAFVRGDGVPRNADLARHWFDRAAPTLEAAVRERARIGSGAPDASRLSQQNPLGVPDILGANVVRQRDGWRIDLAWAAPSGPAGTLFLVELVADPSRPRGGARVAFRETEGSVATFEIGREPAGLIWRVIRLTADRSGYAASPWAAIASTAGEPIETLSHSSEHVVFQVGRTDAAARRLAEEVSRVLSDGGVRTSIEDVPAYPTESAVTYRYGQDADLAKDVAAILPTLGAADPHRTDDPDTPPGEVVVTLVGGPVDGAQAR